MKNFYKILNIPETSTPDEIKKAYRNLAKMYHPDNKETGDAEKFREINEAYENLINPKPKSSFNNSQKYDPFSDFKRTMFNFGMINADIYTSVEISLEEAFNGTSKIALVNGERITIDIPKGITPNQPILKKGKGKTIYFDNDQYVVGDLVIQVNIYQDEKYQFNIGFGGVPRLLQNVNVNMFTALMGGEIILDNIDKTKIKVTIPQGFEDGLILKIPNKGWRYIGSDTRTDLFLKLHIKNGKYEFNNKELKALQAMEKKYGK